MKRILIIIALMFFAAGINVGLALEASSKKGKDKQFTQEEQFARQEAVRGQEKMVIEADNSNSELEKLRLEAEGVLTEDVKRAQDETDLTRQELAREFSVLLDEAVKESDKRIKEAEQEEALALKESLDYIENSAQ